MLKPGLIAALLCMSGCLFAAEPLTPRNMSRGELLYSTHCIACHTSQVHWRDQRLATNWETLRAQVTRWQSVSALGWTAQDIDAVSRYLNAQHYRYTESP